MKDNEKILTRGWRKRNPCYVRGNFGNSVAKKLWKIESISNKLMHLIKENFRQNVETINRFKKAMCGKTKMR